MKPSGDGADSVILGNGRPVGFWILLPHFLYFPNLVEAFNACQTEMKEKLWRGQPGIFGAVRKQRDANLVWTDYYELITMLSANPSFVYRPRNHTLRYGFWCP